MTKRLAIIALAAIMMLGVFGLTGCDSNILKGDPDNPVVESECGYFNIMLRKIDGYAIVLDLTEKGKEQEILAIPSQEQGFIVKQIGWNTGGFTQVGLKSEVLKKIYIPYTITNIVNSVGVKNGECIFLPAQSEIRDFWFGSCQNTVFATQEYLEPLMGFDFYKGWLQLPNIIYFYNYENAPNLGYFWFDNITDQNLFIEPSNPTREGFTFKGWFLDEDCETEWDEVMPKSSDEKIRLYAGWQVN